MCQRLCGDYRCAFLDGFAYACRFCEAAPLRRTGEESVVPSATSPKVKRSDGRIVVIDVRHRREDGAAVGLDSRDGRLSLHLSALMRLQIFDCPNCSVAFTTPAILKKHVALGLCVAGDAPPLVGPAMHHKQLKQHRWKMSLLDQKNTESRSEAESSPNVIDEPTDSTEDATKIELLGVMQMRREKPSTRTCLACGFLFTRRSALLSHLSRNVS